MRVLIDTSYVRRGPSGTAVYVEQLVHALRGRAQVELVEAAGRRLRPGGRNPFRSAVNLLLELTWLHGGLPRAARRAGADVVHHPLPAYSGRIDCAQVTTVHDVAFEGMPGGYGRVWRARARRAYRRAVVRSGAIVCPSESTAADAVAILGAERERIVVAPHGPGQVEGVAAPRRGPAHLLYVGDSQERKNLGLLLEAYARYRAAASEAAELVVAGDAASGAGGPGVRGVPRPTRERLVGLYASALALVHPAAHEGFGLTLLEAMALGTPVVAMRNAATEELGAGAALLVEDARELADALARLCADSGLREELSRRGRERAARFSWRASAQAHERAYTLACR